MVLSFIPCVSITSARLLIAALCFPILLNAQSRQMNAAEIRMGLEKLEVTGSVLYIAAHPDDENTKLLTWLAKGRRVRTGYLSLTRGDGGQNLLGTEQAEELGLIRTQELLAAREIDGAEQFFSRAIDFGFSKTADETFSIWNKELILSDVVRTIRKFKPDVIITRFPPDARAGHGNHAASAILAIEAFSAAADGKRFSGLGAPWQAKRLLWNTYNFGGTDTTSPDQLRVNVGGYNPLLGKSYGELAAASRSQHKTQGFGSASQRGPEYEYFALLAGSPTKTDLLEGVDITWGRIRNGNKVSSLIQKINAGFQMHDPTKSVPELLQLRNLIGKIDDETLKAAKLKELDDLILSCAAIWFEITSLQPEVSIDDSIGVRIQAISLMADKLKLPVTIAENLSGTGTQVLSDKLYAVNKKIAPQALSQPYWLTYNRTLGSYNSSPSAMDVAENEPVSGIFTVTINGHILHIRRPVVYKYADPVKGEVYQPLIITPPVIITPLQTLAFYNYDNSVRVKITAKKDNVSGILSLQSTDKQVLAGSSKPFNLKRKGETGYVDLHLEPKINGKRNSPANVVVTAVVAGKGYSYDQSIINYDHLPLISYFPPAEFKYLIADIKTSGKRLAYINGAGDRIPEALRLLGYTVDVLASAQLVGRDLSVYDAIIGGVRLYNVDEDIEKIQPLLMQYVKDGGTFLVQYNVNNGLKSNQIGPNPFKITRSRVTDEFSPVTLLDSGHAVLNYPNKISIADFNNWVQERGLYFADDFDKHYTAILGMHDPGEPQNNGSLIVSDYGKGRFVYTSLSFFRQLPAGVPGAYRLFVNLIAKRQLY